MLQGLGFPRRLGRILQTLQLRTLADLLLYGRREMGREWGIGKKSLAALDEVFRVSGKADFAAWLRS